MKLASIVGALFLLSFFLPQQAPAAQKEWTVLVFLNGNNSLDSFGTDNLKQMEQVGSTDEVNLVVQWASYAAEKTKRLLVQKSSNPDTVTSPVVEEMPRVDMGDYKVLREFLEWGIRRYPAKHYFVDVWNHGGGWHRTRLGSRDISYDEYTGHIITTEQLGAVLRSTAAQIGHKIDAYGSDACLMAMAEVMNEVSDSVRIFVGSEETEPGAGWPYGEWLKRWVTPRHFDVREVAKALTEEYVKSFSSSTGSEVTLSAVDLDQLGGLNRALKNFVLKAKALPASDLGKLKDAALSSLGFYFSDYVDLGDYAAQVEKAGVAGLKASDVRAIRDALAKFVVQNNFTSKFARSSGVSIWFPDSSYTFTRYRTRYAGLKIEAATGWAEMLDAVFK